MAIKAGQILHVMNQFVIDRIQTAGPGDLNIPQEKIYELGNYQSVAVVRDVPDLSFNLECLDVDTEVEALLTGSTDPYADASGTAYELVNARPIDIISPWKTPYGDFEAVQGVAIPALALESASYRYGLQDNAGETFTLNGDSIYYVPGTPWQDIAVGDGTTVEFDFEHPNALTYTEGGVTFYALCVSVDGVRYTQVDNADLAANVAAGNTLVYAPQTVAADGIEFAVAPETGAVVSIVYGSDDPATYGQTGQDPWGTSGNAHLVHQTVSVKPAAIRGKDIDVYFSTVVPRGSHITNKELTSNVATLTTSTAHGLVVGDVVVVTGVDATFNGTYTVTVVGSSTTFSYAKTAANVASTAVAGTSALASAALEVRWPDVQSFTLDWRQTLEEDYEFGNARAVAREATDVPTVTGAVELRPRNVEAFFTRLRQITGIAADKVIGPASSVVGALRVELRNPESGGSTAVAAGTVLKTHYVADARFTIPGYSGQVQQKLNVTLNYESDTGQHQVFKGPRT
jgi:hypothetical protein